LIPLSVFCLMFNKAYEVSDRMSTSFFRAGNSHLIEAELERSLIFLAAFMMFAYPLITSMASLVQRSFTAYRQFFYHDNRMCQIKAPYADIYSSFSILLVKSLQRDSSASKISSPEVFSKCRM
jgi:hypothetical protein